MSIEKTGTKNCISITANKKGKATITAKVGNKKLKCKVTVTKAMSSKALKKYIKVDTSTIDRQYMTYTNTSKKYYLGVHSTFHLYDDQGSSVDWNTPSAKLAPGKSVKIWVYNPHKYTNSKVDLENVWIDYEYHPIKATAEVQPVTPENILPVVVTNKSLYNESLYYVTVFFKKEGEIIWALQSDTDKDHPGEGMKPGDSRTVEFWLNEFVPTDYDEIKVQIGRSSGY